VGILVAIIAIMGRCVTKRRAGAKGPTAPPEQVAAPIARAAIEDAAQRNLDEIDVAVAGPDVADELARLANRASKRRTGE
jgi:hypothetical protein